MGRLSFLPLVLLVAGCTATKVEYVAVLVPAGSSAKHESYAEWHERVYGMPPTPDEGVLGPTTQVSPPEPRGTVGITYHPDGTIAYGNPPPVDHRPVFVGPALPWPTPDPIYTTPVVVPDLSNLGVPAGYPYGTGYGYGPPYLGMPPYPNYPAYFQRH